MSTIVANLLKICANQLAKWMKWNRCALKLNWSVRSQREAHAMVVAVAVRRTEIQVRHIDEIEISIRLANDFHSIWIAGVADVEIGPCPYQSPQNETHTEAHLKRSALSNSLLDMHEQCKCVEHVNVTIV